MFFTPILILYGFLFTFYWIDDPFRVLKKYDRYLLDGLEINRDFISSQYYLENYQDRNYNSFVFGSSRSICIDIDDWKGYLNKSNIPYHFDTWGESIFGIHSKIKKIDSNNSSIKDVILFLCMDKTFGFTEDRPESYLYRKHPDFANSSHLEFHKLMVYTFMNLQFCTRYLYWKATHVYQPFLEGYIVQHTSSIAPISNQVSRDYNELQIQLDSLKYYRQSQDFNGFETGINFSKVPVINKKSKELLHEISLIFKKQNTNCKIVVSPIFGGQEIHPEDLNFLKSEFSTVYNLTGKNELTTIPGYYHDIVHPRRIAGKKILKILYEADQFDSVKKKN